MTTEMFTCGQQLGERLNCSPESARAFIRRLRLPRQKANRVKALVAVDLSEITHRPMPRQSPRSHWPIIVELKASVETPQMGRQSSLAWSPCDSA
jgi:hypothetical protein